MLMGIVAHLTQLPVEMILLVIYKVYLILMGCDKLGDLCLGVVGILAPLGEVRGVVHVAEHAECGIGCKPLAVACHKLDEVGRIDGVGTLLGVYFTGVGSLGGVHSLIVDLLEGVKLASEVVIVGPTLLGWRANVELAL